MAKECTLSTGKLPAGGMPRNSVVRIIDHPDMTYAAVYCGHKATYQTKQRPRSVIHVKAMLLSRVKRKLVFWVSDQVRHKPDCMATEDG